MTILNLFINDIFERIATEAYKLGVYSAFQRRKYMAYSSPLPASSHHLYLLATFFALTSNGPQTRFRCWQGSCLNCPQGAH